MPTRLDRGVVRRILGRLRRAGLVAARTGAGGGFTLVKAPGRVSLAEIYQAVEEQAVIARHAAPNPACPVGRNIGGVLDRVSLRAERAMLQSLAGLTLVSVVSQVKTKAGAARRKETA